MDHSLSARGEERGASSKPRAPWLALALLSAGACGGVSPRPEVLAAELPEAIELAPDARAEVERQTEAAVSAALEADFDSARSLAAAVLDRDPAVARAIAVLARCRVAEAGESDPPSLALLRQAEGELLVAQRLAPDDSLPLRWRAECLEHDGHRSAAAVAAEAAVERSPGDPSLRWLAGRLRFELAEPRAALEQLQYVVRAVPDHAGAWFRIAQCQVRIATGARARKLPKVAEPAATAAVRAFARYRELRPADPEGPLGEAHARGLLSAGTDAEQKQRRATMLGLLRVAATLGPSAPAPRHGLGVLLEAEEPEVAEQHYRAALERDPYYVPSLLNLTALLRSSQRSDAARGYAWRALRAHRVATAVADSVPERPDSAAAELSGRGAMPPGATERAVTQRAVTQQAVTLLSSAERRALEAFLASAESEAGAPVRRP